MYRNNIISISGMPVSGKSTTIKTMIDKLEKSGYDKSNIHLVSTGKKFREYFNLIVDVIRNSENLEQFDIDFPDNEIRSLFASKEFKESLIQTILQLKKINYDTQKFSIEEANNLEQFKDIRAMIDRTIDENIENLGKNINQTEHKDEIWIIDSRLAFHNIPSSFAVRLTIDEDIAAKRLLNDSSRGKEDNSYRNLEEAKEAVISRTKGEIKRYKERYNIDLEDVDNYNLLIDTSYSTTDDIADIILSCNDRFMQGKDDYAKNWASPKRFLPLQTERETLGRGLSMNMDEMIERIKSDGYNPLKPINTIKVDGRYYIIDGHHRNFGAALAGKTLVSYNVMAENDEKIINSSNTTARQRAKGICKPYLFGHEWMIGKDFSYKEIYPDLYDELDQDLPDPQDR